MRVISATLACFSIVLVSAQDLDYAKKYLDVWKEFYPSQAMQRGMNEAIFNFENFSRESIDQWLEFNKEIFRELSDQNNAYVLRNRINARLLKVQAKREIDKWETNEEHKNSLSLYVNLIDGALGKVFDAEYLTEPEKSVIVCHRLEAVQSLCKNAIDFLRGAGQSDVERGLIRLAKIETLLNQSLPEKVKKENSSNCPNVNGLSIETSGKVRALIDYLEKEIVPNALDMDNILGREEYARQLALYTDSSLTPEELAKIALEEIETVRKIMGEVSKEYLDEQYPDQNVSTNYETVVKAALDDMGKDAPINGEEYLEFWKNLSARAIKFIEDNKIATLPKNQTLQIKSAPESAGPMARIGWVSSAPPFAPNPMTTLYLPSIPDSLPEQERIDFWSSFNKPFNRMIVIHELFPGHYMQLKIARETPHPVRLLFPFGIYTEGWATFCERVVLDAGWEKENKLTFLAHLRKRLENANRAYTSVQVHCNGWDREKVMQFSTETSWVAPQFAKSLWGRLMRSPMQLTSYFLGGKQFTDLLVTEIKRLGNDFDLTLFMDTILRAGPIPIDEFYEIFEQTISK